MNPPVISVRILPILLTTLLTAGCAEPTWQFPGKALAGEEHPLDLSHMAPDGGVMQLETNPAEPYSVNVGYAVIDGNMYIDPAESRRWYQNIKQNPTIRLRFDGKRVVHPATAVAEKDPAVLSQFEADRRVLRIVPAGD